MMLLPGAVTVSEMMEDQVSRLKKWICRVVLKIRPVGSKWNSSWPSDRLPHHCYRSRLVTSTFPQFGAPLVSNWKTGSCIKTCICVFWKFYLSCFVVRPDVVISNCPPELHHKVWQTACFYARSIIFGGSMTAHQIWACTWKISNLQISKVSESPTILIRLVRAICFFIAV